MNEKLTLDQVKAAFGYDRVFETENSFVVNDFGKYASGLTFVLPKEFELDKFETPISPIKPAEYRPISESMNLPFDGSQKSILYGDFWVSPKGNECFRPKDPVNASHILVEVSWGGPFDRTRGNKHGGDIDGVEYFKHRSSNGGGAGRDYWIVPWNAQFMYDPDSDKYNFSTNDERGNEWKNEFSGVLRSDSIERDSFLKEKIAADQASREHRAEFIPQIESLSARIEALHYQPVTIRDSTFSFGGTNCYYTPENVENLSAYVQDLEAREEFKKERTSLEEQIKPYVDDIKSRANAVGLDVVTTGERDHYDIVIVRNTGSRYSSSEVCSERVIDSSNRLYMGGFERIDQVLEKIESEKEEADRIEANQERIDSVLASTDLPENLYFVFSGSELTDSEIKAEVKAIVGAQYQFKDEMTVHELANCGIDRRCNAIERLIDASGGHSDRLSLRKGSQIGTIRFAQFLLDGDRQNDVDKKERDDEDKIEKTDDYSDYPEDDDNQDDIDSDGGWVD